MNEATLFSIICAAVSDRVTDVTVAVAQPPHGSCLAYSAIIYFTPTSSNLQLFPLLTHLLH